MKYNCNHHKLLVVTVYKKKVNKYNYYLKKKINLKTLDGKLYQNTLKTNWNSLC